MGGEFIGGAAKSFGLFAGRLGISAKETINSYNIQQTVSLAYKDLRIAQEAYIASSPNAAEALARKYAALERAQNSAVKTDILPDGSIKYYDEESPARNYGLTRGTAYVTEYNPMTGEVSSSMESYDHSGFVIRIRPKMFNGLELESLHFPPTGNELRKISDNVDYINNTDYKIR